MNNHFLMVSLVASLSFLSIQSANPGAQILLAVAAGAVVAGPQHLAGALDDQWIAIDELQRLIDNEGEKNALAPQQDYLKKQKHSRHWVSAKQEKRFKPRLMPSRHGARRQQNGALNRYLKKNR